MRKTISSGVRNSATVMELPVCESANRLADEMIHHLLLYEGQQLFFRLSVAYLPHQDLH